MASFVIAKSVNALRSLSLRNSSALSILFTESGSFGKRRLSNQTEDEIVQTPSIPKDDNTKYNCPEYYTYNEFSYYDIDAACVKQRLPQPAAEFK